jgi:hypothetical protein
LVLSAHTARSDREGEDERRQDPKHDEPEANAEDVEDLDLEPGEVKDVKSGAAAAGGSASWPVGAGRLRAMTKRRLRRKTRSATNRARPRRTSRTPA